MMKPSSILSGDFIERVAAGTSLTEVDRRRHAYVVSSPKSMCVSVMSGLLNDQVTIPTVVGAAL